MDCNYANILIIKMKKIFYGRHNITDEDIASLIEVLKSDNLTQGPKITEFEKNFAAYVGSKYAVAVSSGTAALHLCTLATGINKGDKVITTPNTFVASANCVLYCGAEVVFSDIDNKTFLLDIEKVRKLLDSSPKGTYKAIIPVNFAGLPVNLDQYRQLANQYDLFIIEDACHSPGGFYFDSKNQKHTCGNGNHADLSIFSFHPVKHIACGEGGMVTTNNKELRDKIINLRTHGIQQNPDLKISNHGPWYYEMQELGFNYRMTDIQASLGISQLKRAGENLEKRISIAKKYELAFQDSPFIISQPGYIEGHAYHLYVIRVRNRNGLYQYLRDKQIYCQIHYIPTHLMPYYKDLGYNEGDFPVAEEYYSQCLTIPIYPTLEDEDQNYIIEMIKNFYDA